MSGDRGRLVLNVHPGEFLAVGQVFVKITPPEQGEKLQEVDEALLRIYPPMRGISRVCIEAPKSVSIKRLAGDKRAL